MSEGGEVAEAAIEVGVIGEIHTNKSRGKPLE